jgi:phosphoglycerate dehydrogenase-like enzyme
MYRGLLALDPRACELIYGDSGIREIGNRLELIAGPRAVDRRELARHPDWLKQVEVVFSGWHAPTFDKALLDAMPSLKSVFYGAGSVHGIVTDEFWSRDITLTSAAGMNAIPVAEYTCSAILLSLKGLWHYIVRQHRDRNFPGAPVNIRGAYKSTVGIVGFGHIGRLVREMLRPYSLHVTVYDPFLGQREAERYEVFQRSLECLFETSDVISLHAPALPATDGMVNRDMLNRIRPGGTLINTARGELIREDELFSVLSERPDITAVLDTFRNEPVDSSHPLLGLPNVIATPHIAGSQGDECLRMGRFMIDEFDRWVTGASLLGKVTRDSVRDRA